MLKPIELVGVIKLGASAREALAILECASYSPNTMNFAELQGARNLRQRLLKNVKATKTSTAREGALDAIGGKISSLEDEQLGSLPKQEREVGIVTSTRAEVASPLRCPRATSQRGFATIKNKGSLAPAMRKYFVVGDDGKVRFFEDELEADEYFADPLSTRAANVVDGTLDLASVMTLAKSDKAIEITTPAMTYLLVPETSLGTLFDSLNAIVSAFHRALASLFGRKGEVAEQEPKIGTAAINAMRQLEAAANEESDASEGEKTSTRALRRRILDQVGSIHSLVADAHAAHVQESKEDNFAYPENVVTGTFMKLGSGWFSGWHRRLFALIDGDMLVWFSSEDERRTYFSDAMSDEQRQGYKRKLDLLAVVSCKDDVASGRHVLQLSSPTRSLKISGVEGEAGSFERLFALLRDLVGASDRALGRLAQDNELTSKSVDLVDPSRIGAKATAVLTMLERYASDPSSMTYDELRKARQIRMRLKSEAQEILESRSTGFGGGLDSVQGLVPFAEGKDAGGRTGQASVVEEGRPSATVHQGFMIVSSDDSLAPPVRVYGVVGSDSKLRFFESKADASSFFADPFSAASKDLIRGVIDLGSVISTSKPDDGYSFNITTPSTTYTIQPEDASMLGSLYDALKSIVSVLQRALAALFPGNDELARGNPELASDISPSALNAMRQLESAANVAGGGGRESAGEKIALQSLRQRVLNKAGEIEIASDELIASRAEDGRAKSGGMLEIATESKDGGDSAPATALSFAYPDNVVTGSFMKLGSGFFSGWHQRLFALIDGDMLVWFSSENERRAYFSDSMTDEQRQSNKRKLDLLTVVSCTDEVISGRHMLNLSSLTRSLKIAGVQGEAGVFEKLFALLRNLVGASAQALGRLAQDDELTSKSVGTVDPSKVGAKARAVLSLLERLASDPKSMTFDESRQARQIRSRLKSEAKDTFEAHSAGFDGGLDDLQGLVGSDEGEIADGAEQPSRGDPPSATEYQGFMLFNSDDSLAPPVRMYGVVGSDGRLRFFETKMDASSFFADPFSSASKDLIRGGIDLGSVVSTSKSDDGKSINLITPSTTYTIQPEDASMLSGLYDAIKSIVALFHRALAALFSGNDGLARGNPELISTISPAALSAMRHLDTEANVTSGGVDNAEESLVSEALRKRILAKARGVEGSAGESMDAMADFSNANANEDGDDNGVALAKESKVGQQAAKTFAYPENVVTGSFMKLGTGFFSGWHLRLFALIDGDMLVWFSSEDERRAYFDAMTDEHRQNYKRKLDLLTVVACKDGVRSGRHVLNLSSPARSLKIAAVQGKAGAFEKLFALLRNLVGASAQALGRLARDEELTSKPVDSVDLSKIGSKARAVLTLLERYASDPKTMAFDKALQAKQLRRDLKTQAKEVFASRATEFVGDIDALQGLFAAAESSQHDDTSNNAPSLGRNSAPPAHPPLVDDGSDGDEGHEDHDNEEEEEEEDEQGEKKEEDGGEGGTRDTLHSARSSSFTYPRWVELAGEFAKQSDDIFGASWNPRYFVLVAERSGDVGTMLVYFNTAADCQRFCSSYTLSELRTPPSFPRYAKVVDLVSEVLSVKDVVGRGGR